MTRAWRLVVNVLFGAVFLVGTVLVWVGLQAFVLQGEGVGRDRLSLAAGFGIWVGLAAVERVASAPRIGGRP